MGAHAEDAKRKRCDDDSADNMFDSSAAAASALNSARSATQALKRLNTGLRQQAADAGQSLGSGAWDDEDGYYLATIHETMGDRYVVTESNCGKGVFSSIVKAKDVDLQASGEAMVAIKVVRSNEAFRKAAEKEVQILQKLQSCDGEGRRYIVQMLSSFAYRDHLCIVFECLWDDCREALRKLTKGRGMTLSVVRVYSHQLLLGLRHMEKCGILHADIKPDNILMSEDQTMVKFCDLGTATDVDDAEISSYIVSRSYRAPEIIIGLKPTCAADTFSLACTLFELFTGKVLASGKSNHDQLRKIMELKGKMPASMVKAGSFWKRHFDQQLVFKPDVVADPRHSSDDNSGSALRLQIEKLKAQMEVFPKQQIKDLIFERVGPQRCTSTRPEDQQYVQWGTQFASLLEEMLSLDPQKRLTPKEGLNHAFFK